MVAKFVWTKRMNNCRSHPLLNSLRYTIQVRDIAIPSRYKGSYTSVYWDRIQTTKAGYRPRGIRGFDEQSENSSGRGHEIEHSEGVGHSFERRCVRYFHGSEQRPSSRVELIRGGGAMNLSAEQEAPQRPSFEQS